MSGVDARQEPTLGRLTATVLILVLMVELTLWGAFLVPVRGFGMPLPVGPLVAGAANLTLGVAARRVSGSRLGAGATGILWLLLALTLGSPHHGSLVVPGSPMGYAYLLVGAVGAVAGAVVGPSPSGRVRR